MLMLWNETLKMNIEKKKRAGVDHYLKKKIKTIPRRARQDTGQIPVPLRPRMCRRVGLTEFQ